MSRSSLTRRAALQWALVLPPAAMLARAVRAAPAAAAVQIKGFAFVPEVITVASGVTVTWTNTDEDPHTVRAVDKSFASSALDTDDRYSFTFDKPGEYVYYCSLHPHMKGRVVVTAG